MRRLKITLIVDDEGGPDDYTKLMNALMSMGEVIDEEEITEGDPVEFL